MNKILEVKNLTQIFRIDGRELRAVDDITFDVFEGEVLGIVGESGSGKSTAGRDIIGLYEDYNGEILFEGKHFPKKRTLKQRKDIQMIFQDPFASINPRFTILQAIEEGMILHFPKMKKKERYQKIVDTMTLVGLREDHLTRYPHEFSGGQLQRVGIARALVLEPKVLIADEPISALDVSIQAQVVNLLQELQQKFKLTIIFIAHDLSMVKYISNRILVMKYGKIVELSSADEVYNNPYHPYTKSLLSAIPHPDPISERKRERIKYTDAQHAILIEKGEIKNLENNHQLYGSSIITRALVLEANVEREIRSEESSFRVDSFKEKAKILFLGLRRAWENDDLGLLRRLSSDEFYLNQKTKIENTLKKNEEYKFETKGEKEVFLTDFKIEGEIEYLTVNAIGDFKTRLTVKETGEEEVNKYSAAELRFIKKVGVDMQREILRECPFCKNPLFISEEGNCKDCQEKVTTGDYHWLLDSYRPLRTFELGEIQAKKQIAELGEAINVEELKKNAMSVAQTNLVSIMNIYDIKGEKEQIRSEKEQELKKLEKEAVKNEELKKEIVVLKKELQKPIKTDKLKDVKVDSTYIYSIVKTKDNNEIISFNMLGNFTTEDNENYNRMRLYLLRTEDEKLVPQKINLNKK